MSLLNLQYEPSFILTRNLILFPMVMLKIKKTRPSHSLYINRLFTYMTNLQCG